MAFFKDGLERKDGKKERVKSGLQDGFGEREREKARRFGIVWQDMFRERARESERKWESKTVLARERLRPAEARTQT